jgi:hypothetical protein
MPDENQSTESPITETVGGESGATSGSNGTGTFKCWQAPDRDSPTVIDLDFTIEMKTSDAGSENLKALFQMDGMDAHNDELVAKVTGHPITRARRWAKFFANMGLMYRDGQISYLTDWGRYVSEMPEREKRDFRQEMADMALQVLSRYQLKNPADDPESRYPSDCDVHPYWCIWKAADELDGRIHWDEVNRELMHVLKMKDLAPAIENLRQARQRPGYDPVTGGTVDHPLGPRCFDEKDPPAGRTADGQVRDHYLTPLLRKAGFGGLLLVSPGSSGGGYWTIPDDIRPSLHQAVTIAPEFKLFADTNDWFAYYGSIPEISDTEDSIENLDLPETDAVWLEVKSLTDAGSLALLFQGPPGTSKTWYARRIAVKLAGKKERVKYVQFHPSFGYDDFIEGYVPTSTISNAPSMALFQIVPKVFLSFCDIARAHPQETFVLVIDEINRGDVARIFGELLTFVERDYRGQRFTLSYSGRDTSIPKNVILLATMNPYDRSITELDDAMERRFDRISLEPNVNILAFALKNNGLDGATLEGLLKFFKRANELTPHGLGHALFLNIRNETDIVRVWNHSIHFLLQKSFRFDLDKYQELKSFYEPLVTDANALR